MKRICRYAVNCSLPRLSIARSGGIRRALIFFIIVSVSLMLRDAYGRACTDKHSYEGKSDGVGIIVRYIDKQEIESADSFLEEFYSILPDGLDKDSISSVSAPSLLSEMFGAVFDGVKGAAPYFITLLGVVLLFAVFEVAMADSLKISATAVGAATAVLTVPVFSSLASLISETASGIESASAFFSALIPILTSISAACGAVSTASTQAVGMSISLSFVSLILSELLLPIAAMSFALALISSFDAEGVGSGISSGIRSLFAFLLGISTTVIIAAVALQTIIASANDSAALRTVKYAVSGMIPMVGGVVSGTLATLASGLSAAGGIVGGGAIVALIAIFTAPMIQLIVYRAALGAAVVIADALGAKQGGKILSALRSSQDMLIATLACCGVVYMLEIIVFIQHGVPLI